MKVLVVSGFLGAGKTTFIKELVNRTGRDIAVFENEYAAEGVDKAILEEGINNGEVNIFEMEQGCICCSTKGDFKASVLTIANSVDPEILIVEPTGVGMLSNVLANIKEIEYERIKLLAPVTIVDGKSIDRYSKQYDELFNDQVKGSDVIVISKMESSGDDEKEEVVSKIKAINPQADVICDHYTKEDEVFFHNLLEHEFGREVSPKEENAGILPENFSIEGIEVDSLPELICFLEDIIRGEYGEIIRAKGHLQGKDEILRFEVADRTYYITGVTAEIKPSAAFIGHDIHRQALRKKLFRGIEKASGQIIKKDVRNLFRKRPG